MKTYQVRETAEDEWRDYLARSPSAAAEKYARAVKLAEWVPEYYARMRDE